MRAATRRTASELSPGTVSEHHDGSLAVVGQGRERSDER